MADEQPEVIRQQMEETRTALSEKLETLQNHVVGTVQDATSAVAETVTNVKDAVQETVDTVKGTVRDTVEGVKDTFDFSRQVDRNPWLMVGGSLAVGFLFGRLLGGRQAAPSGGLHEPAYSPMRPLQPQSERFAAEPTRVNHSVAEAPAPGWLSSLSDTFGSEIDKLKGLAIGTGLGVVREMITRNVPDELSDRLTEVVDDITRKLGGQPIKAPLLEEEEDPPRGHLGNGPHRPGFAAAGGR